MNVLYLVNDDIYGGFWLNKHSCDDPPAPGLHHQLLVRLLQEVHLPEPRLRLEVHLAVEGRRFSLFGGFVRKILALPALIELTAQCQIQFIWRSSGFQLFETPWEVAISPKALVRNENKCQQSPIFASVQLRIRKVSVTNICLPPTSGQNLFEYVAKWNFE